jgi:hypothetical protein
LEFYSVFKIQEIAIEHVAETGHGGACIIPALKRVRQEDHEFEATLALTQTNKESWLSTYHLLLSAHSLILP